MYLTQIIEQQQEIKPENENIPPKSLIQDIITSDTNIINNAEEKKEEPVIEEEKKIEQSEQTEIKVEENINVENNDNNTNKPELPTLDQRIIEEKTEINENKDGEVTTTVIKEETTVVTTEEKKYETDNNNNV